MFSIITAEDVEEQIKITELYEHYQKLMFVVAKRILQDNYMAEDAIHEAFIKIMRYMDHIDEVESVKTKGLMILIVERVAIDLYRKQKRCKECAIEDFEERMYYSTKFDEGSNPESLHILDGLPKKYAEVISLKFYYGYRTKEIAQILSINENTVRTNIARGKKMLSKLINESGEATSNE